jgi:hypothetical protein
MFTNTTLLTVVTIGLLAIIVLYFVMRKLLPTTDFQERKDFFDLFTKIIGSTVLIVSLLFTWRSTENTLKVSTETLKNAERNLQNAEQKEHAERFLKANEQLASESVYIRAGAIYSLGQLANDSKAYYWRVMQALTDFVRARYTLEETILPRAKCPADIQAAMNVIGWRKLTFGVGDGHENQRLELHETDLRGLILKDKEGTTREGAHLEGAQLWNANLENANLRGVHLEGAILKGAILRNAILYGAYLSDLTDLNGANLEGADFGGAKGLTLRILEVAPEWYKMKLPPEKPEDIRIQWEKLRKENNIK